MEESPSKATNQPIAIRSATYNQQRMNAARLFAGVAGILLCAALVRAVELTDEARRAFDEYAERIGQSFANGPFASVAELAPKLRRGAIIGRSGSGDGIVEVPGGLVHHWRGAVFVPQTTVDAALQLSQSYAQYPRMYASVASSQVLSQNGNTFRVRLRLKERAGVVTSVLDITATVTYVRVDACSGYSVSRATDIREIVAAGQPEERALAPGTGHGYLWQARTFSSYLQQDGGLYLSLETLGLSRRFPAMLGWVIEPIARRLGRKSVEGTLAEFRQALMTAHRIDGRSMKPCTSRKIP